MREKDRQEWRKKGGRTLASIKCKGGGEGEEEEKRQKKKNDRKGVCVCVCVCGQKCRYNSVIG